MRVARVRHCAGCLSGGGAARAPAAYEHRELRRLRPLHTLEYGTARARDRPSSGPGRAPTCKLRHSLHKTVCACSAPVRHCAGCLWRGGTARRAIVARARRAALAVVAPCLTKEHGTRLARGLRYSVEGRAPTCQPRRSLREPACACSALVRTCAGCLWGGGVVGRACRARAPRSGPSMVPPCPMERHCTSVRPPFVGPRPCSHVPATVSTSHYGLRM